MNRPNLLSTIALGCLLVCFWTAADRPAAAQEPADEFLNALRERGYFDTALEYLDWAATSDLVIPEFKDSIDLERGRTLILMSKMERDSAAREKILDQAEAALNQFITDNQTHELRTTAESQLANLRVERARMKIESAKKERTPMAQQATLMAEARTILDGAQKVFEKQKDELGETLKTIKPLDPNNPSDKRLIRIRDIYRTDYLQARLLIPAIMEEKADTYAEDAKERADLLKGAADAYKEVYEDYRLRIAGLYARMYQGRCYTKLKNYTEALSYFNDLLDQPDDHPAFRELKLKVLTLAVDCWLTGGETNYYNEAILKIEPYLGRLNTEEARSDDWLFLRLALARAYKLAMDDLQKKPNPSADEKKLIAEYKRKGGDHATFVSRQQSDYKEPARKLLAEIGGGEYNEGTRPEPKTFTQARDYGREALEDWQTANTVLPELKKRLEEETDPDEKKSIEKEITRYEDARQNGPENSMAYFNQALVFADETTPDSEINVVRYFLAYLYYLRAHYHEAAVVSEFVARRSPGSAGARQCAKIAMACYLKLYKDANQNDREFETERASSIANYIIDQWPGDAEAVEAANTLIAFAIKDGDMQKAQQNLAKIPADSPFRGNAELTTGQALWSSYVRGMADVRADEKSESPPADLQQRKAALNQVKEEAKKTLYDGLERMKGSGDVNETLAAASLSLSQIYVDTGEAAKAVTLLEDPTIGMLTLVKQKHPATEREALVIETYKTALRAYIASMAGSTSTDAVSKAKGIIAALKAKMAEKPNGDKELVAIFISLANDLQKQLDLIESADEKKAMATGLATFLDEVSGGSSEVDILVWAADTYSKVGEAFLADNDKATAKHYFDKSVSAFADILKQGEQKGDDWLSSEVRMQVLMRMAATKRRMGGNADYQEAVKLFADILQEQPAMLNVQLEAAYTYQEWAQNLPPEMARPTYIRAMTGAGEYTNPKTKRKENAVWGWGKLAQVTARYKQYADTFHEARYNLARTRFDFAKIQASASDQKKYKEMAKRDIELTQRLYPDLGGDNWRPKYDRLMREIQQSLGQRPTGLANLTPTAAKQ